MTPAESNLKTSECEIAAIARQLELVNAGGESSKRVLEDACERLRSVKGALEDIRINDLQRREEHFDTT